MAVIQRVARSQLVVTRYVVWLLAVVRVLVVTIICGAVAFDVELNDTSRVLASRLSTRTTGVTAVLAVFDNSRTSALCKRIRPRVPRFPRHRFPCSLQIAKTVPLAAFALVQTVSIVVAVEHWRAPGATRWYSRRTLVATLERSATI